ncbi:MAG: hypothetical protein V2G48_06955 [bacterium JZ-2024 1]
MYNALNFWKAGAKQKTIHTRAGSNRPEDLFAGICITGEHQYEGTGYTYFHYFPRRIMALAYLSGYKWSGSRRHPNFSLMLRTFFILKASAEILFGATPMNEEKVIKSSMVQI